MYIGKEIYWKELAHAIMEAEKSPNELFASQRARKTNIVSVVPVMYL